MAEFNPLNWYWIVNGSTTQVFASAGGNYVPVADAAYAAFLADGNQPTRIASEAELGAVLAQHRIRPANASVLDGFKESHAHGLVIEVPAKLLFWIVNEIRALKGQQPVNAAAFKAFVKDQM